MAKTKKTTRSASRPIPLLAMFLAYLVPGAGHVYLGRTARGLIIFLVIGGLFWSGVGMGGVMTVDSYTERWWFVAQMCTGVHGLIGWQRQQRIYTQIAEDLGGLSPPPPGEVTAEQLRVDARLAEADIVLVAPVATVARAYSGTAGMLNLMCIFDAMLLAMLGITGERRRDEHERLEGPG